MSIPVPWVGLGVRGCRDGEWRRRGVRTAGGPGVRAVVNPYFHDLLRFVDEVGRATDDYP